MDNEFASGLFSTFKASSLFDVPEARVSSHLCEECQAVREELWRPAFSVTYDVSKLEVRSKLKECDLCGLFWRTCERHGGTVFPTVQFDSVDSSLRMNGGGHPVLSIFRSPDLKARIANNIQIGFAELPEVGKSTHLEVIRQWLNDCDGKHKHSTCQAAKQGSKPGNEVSKRLPTRLIDVGETGDNKVRLWETGANDTGEWVALSHQWGPKPHFSTNRGNLKDHIEGMNFETLPGTFKDAVTVTRAIRRRYLWIDSICIIQGEDGDFNQEAKRMEEVYSGAYCILAAGRATGHFSGFLQARNERDYVTLRRENEAPFYICQAIDDFKTHVLEGGLNSRGWVMQEHALARRTIFFTEHQTYWECGGGVRCETMTKMNNNLAAFLGDPNFPQILIDAPQGERILRYQDLYRAYSRLGLSNPCDRPMAIDGLQRRLLRTMKAQGGFGVFNEGETRGLLRRSLLWHRGSDTASLSRIKFPADRVILAVPSWSWMAYTGGIDYLKLDFGGFEWEDIRSPWSRSADNVPRTEIRGGNIALTVMAREYDPNAAVQGEGLLILDTPGGSEQPKTMCVVLGIQKGTRPREDKIHYLLIVTPTTALDRDGSKLYERVGAGYLPGRCIALSGSMVNIH